MNQGMSDIPSADFFRVGTESADVIVADLEDSAQGAAVLACVVVHAHVVFTAVFRMSVARERSSGHFGRLGALESASDFYATNDK